MNNPTLPTFDFQEITTFKEFSDRYFELRGELPTAIKNAYLFAEERHQGQKRLVTNQDYIIHPLTVAYYATAIDLDEISIIAALLHDTVEDTEATIEELESQFGTEIAYLVHCLTDITEVSDLAEFNEDLINSRRVVIQAANDIRVIMIKLCDKMHNLLTQSEDKKVKTALKVKKIWEPLSEYVGLYKFKRKFQDEVFKILEPNNYAKSITIISEMVVEQKDAFEASIEEIKTILIKNNVTNYTIEGRIKSAKSFFDKVKRVVDTDNVTRFPKTNDIFGCRVILNDTQDCYITLGLIHSTFEYIPEKFNDYIVKPKPNGYRSIQTIIKYRDIVSEIQIRTYAMHDFNEFGPASHFAYKENTSKDEDYYWVKELNEAKNKEDHKIKAFSDSVFTFTPKGKVIMLRKGSTPIDFAYAVHSDIGNSYLGAKINTKMVDMKYELKTGDICEILTIANGTPKRDWIVVAKMSKTKHQIRRHLQ